MATIGIIETVSGVFLTIVFIITSLHLDEIQIKTTFGEYLIILLLLMMMGTYAAVIVGIGTYNLSIVIKNWKRSRV